MNDELKAAIRNLRSGDALSVRRLADLAKTVVDVLALVDEIHAKGAHVVDAEGRRSDKDAVTMLRDSLPYLRKGASRRVARKTGGKGGRPLAKRAMPPEKAELIWFNSRKYRTNKDAIAAMTGWSLSAAYKAFKSSGRAKTGRPKKSR